MDAVSLSGSSYRAASAALDLRAAVPPVDRRPAADALAALARPDTQVSAPSEAAGDIGDLSFLYGPGNLPVQPAATTDARVSAERSPTARLAIESNDLNLLMASFLTARTPSANPAPSPDVPAQQSGAEAAHAARQSAIAQIYDQF